MASTLKVAYNQVFESEQGKLVLSDLMTFAHMREPTRTINATELAIREGRRDTIMHILECMNMPNLEIVDLIVGENNV